MVLEGQLIKNYNELYKIILDCYKDVFILERYKKLEDEKNEMYVESACISTHFVFLAQKDLALTLWKIYCDIDSKSNTIPKFRNDINDKLRESGYIDKQVEKKNKNGYIENELNRIRQKFLAHTDINRTDSRIKISELNYLLSRVLEEFNDVCEVIDNKDINRISQATIDLEKLRCNIALNVLYERFDR